MIGTNMEPEKLRPELHERIDRMDSEQLELLHRIVLKLEDPAGRLSEGQWFEYVVGAP